ncbi:MAG TPA: hypothetical protein VK166_01540 [Chitinophagaceae bacterium]|nr:hypothetical protein [Chitinophagaceae bacterium]
MKLHYIGLSAILLFATIAVSAQSNYIPQGSKEYILLDRLEIKAQKDTVLNFSHIKPFNRKWWVNRLEAIRADSIPVSLTSIDQYNIQRALLNNLEWVTTDKAEFQSKKSLWNTFFKTPANMVEVDQKDFYLSVNPVLQLYYGKETNNDDPVMLNARGIVARGMVGRKVGFYTYLVENQERGPQQYRDFVSKYRAVPGAGFYKSFKTTGYDYFDARGGISFNIAKYIDFQFGYDKQFLGNGYRSLFLSDFSNNYLYMNLNLRVWRLNYVAKTMQLTSQYERGPSDSIYPKKYAAIHHISFNAPKWLTIGLFEGIVFSRLNDFEFAYLNPIIFLRPVEQNMGSGDNAFVGVDFKANIAKRFQVYGQMNFDEFVLKEMKAGNGWWANKWSLQLGGKYIDAFGVKNLDLQAEANWIRPFTYSHYDSIANYTHYNQPLAHPLLANVQEFIGIARYQPAPKWYVQGKLIAWQQGSDTASKNFGNNIFLDSDTRPGDYGYNFGSAVKKNGVNGSLWLAYEWKENFFIEGNLAVRKFTGSDTRTTASLGVRWNMARREYDY